MTRQGLLKQIQRRNEPLNRIAELEKRLEAAKKILMERENRIKELEAQIERMSELINRYYMVCTEIPKELRTMTFDSCLEDTFKMVRDREVEND